MNVNLDEWRVTDATEAVNLSGLDDQNIPCPRLEFLSIDGPPSAPFPHELHFVVRMAMRPWSFSREGSEEECGDIHIAVVGTNEIV
jgi:hypothetical protein